MDDRTIRLWPGEPGRLIVRLPYSPDRVARIKTIPGRCWDPDRKHWTVPHLDGMVARLRELFAGEPLELDAPLAQEAPAPTPERHRASQALVQRLREAVRTRNLSPRTADTYANWTRRYLLSLNGDIDATGEAEIGRFLSKLALEGDVSGSTQNQALNAILFLYQKVLRKDISLVSGVVRAKKPERLPVVLGKEEVGKVLACMSGVPRLMAALLYGAGLRLMECCELRVKDVDFDKSQLVVRAGKGNKDRVTMLPAGLKEPLARHLKQVRRQHERDLGGGFGAVSLPNALATKYPTASREWAWQWVFPATSHYLDARTGERRRHHLHETVLQRAFKEARLRSGIAKHAGCHTLRQIRRKREHEGRLAT